jgi:hypothetical protein
MKSDPMSESDARLVALLRLKRHETPGQAYFDGLLPRVHARLRAEMLRKSSTALLAERLGVFFDNLAGGRWVAGGLAGYAAAICGGVAILQWSADPGPDAPAYQPVSLQPGAPVHPHEIRVPFKFKIVPVPAVPSQPTPAGEAANAGTGAAQAVGHDTGPQ